MKLILPMWVLFLLSFFSFHAKSTIPFFDLNALVNIKFYKSAIYKVNTAVFSLVWNASGNYTKNTYKVISYYKFTWKDDEIIAINTFWDDSAFYKEFSARNKNL